MSSLSIAELIQGVQYRIYSDGGCKGMESTVYRTFVGISSDGKPLFYEDSMKVPVAYGAAWSIYRM